MDYVLYTPNLLDWNNKYAGCWEIVYYRNADRVTVLEDIYDASCCNTGLCFWLGAEGDK